MAQQVRGAQARGACLEACCVAEAQRYYAARAPLALARTSTTSNTIHIVDERLRGADERYARWRRAVRVVHAQSSAVRIRGLIFAALCPLS